MNWLQDIKIEELPPQYQDIARQIGLESTIALAEYYGKLGFYFAVIKPGKPLSADYQEMSARIGLENTIRLANYLKGELVYFTALDAVIREKKYAYIIRHFTGDNHAELARSTNFSERWVYEVLWEEQKKKRMARQLKLF